MKTKVWENRFASALAVFQSCLSLFGLVLVLSLNGFAAEKPAAGRAPEWAKLVERAYSVDAVLLRHDGIGSIMERTKRVHIDKTRTGQLKKLLQADESYAAVGTHCSPVFGARLVLHLAPPTHNASKEQPETLTLDLCFQCGHVSAVQGAKRFDIEHFHPMRNQLLRIFRDLFPKDADLTTVAE